MRALLAPALLAIAAASVAPSALAQAAPLATVKSLDVGRYLGTWHEIAMIPNFFQRNCVRGTTATYAAAQDGAITVRNRCTLADGSEESVTGAARRSDTAEPGRFEVRFAPAWLSWLPLVWANYWVIALADDYRYAVVGEPGRDYLWILARATTLSKADRDTIDVLLRSAGYDPARLVETPHSGPAQARP